MTVRPGAFRPAARKERNRAIRPLAANTGRFFRTPPFPGAGAIPLARAGDQGPVDDSELDRLIDRVAKLKVGGSFWAAQPPVPATSYTLVRAQDGAAQEAARQVGGPVIIWSDRGQGDVSGDCDPWHFVAGASLVTVNADDELAMIAAIAGVPVRCIGDGRFKGLENGGRTALRQAFREVALEQLGYLDPFTGQPSDVAAAVELCGFWRKLIDSNRQIAAAIGFARWKRGTVAPLLWGGTQPVRFMSGARHAVPGQTLAVWKSRTPPRALESLQGSGAKLVEVEDGFIRSTGLGADCVPPLSIVVDSDGIYFDPRQPSDLEQMLERGRFHEHILGRARRLREVIVQRGISKYSSAARPLERRAEGKRHLLVPGQVEDDRSILCGGGSVKTNLELLRRVRERAPDAYILYKPHPDVEAGHRIGAIPDEVLRTLADEVVRDESISSLLAMVDEVHVNTSLAGFEALLRLKPVTTYGVPFFAGWGLTTDLGDVPSRRGAKRTLDELVAAALLLYPRYLDPITGLPCPPEILIERLSERGTRRGNGALVRLRQLQGQLRRVALALRAR